MTIYVKPDLDMEACLRSAITAYHRDLDANEVFVSLVVAIAKEDENGDKAGPALKVGGYPAMASIRIVPQRDRVQGLGDAEVTIDGDRWVLLSPEERLAIMDHELCHLELVMKDDGLARDDGGRPKLKMRKHDHQFGWFDEVAERHGKSSQERQQAQALVDEKGQVYFSFLASTVTKPVPHQIGGAQ